MEGLGLIGLGIIGLIYFLPSIIASKREHHNTLAIVMLNIFGGVVGIGWLVALVWSCTVVKSDLKEQSKSEFKFDKE